MAETVSSSHETCLRSFQWHIDVDRAFAKLSLRVSLDPQIDMSVMLGHRTPSAATIARLAGSVANSADSEVNAGPHRRRRKGSIAR